MTFLKTLLTSLPLILAGTGAFLSAQMLTTRPEQEQLPIAYIAGSYAYGADQGLYVIDALTRDTLYEIDESEYACPGPVSPDGRWFLYFSGTDFPEDYPTYLVDLHTGERTAITPYPMQLVNWSPDSTRFAYRRWDSQGLKKALYFYDATSASVHLLGTFSTVSMYNYRWFNDHDVIYAMAGENLLTVYQTSSASHEVLLPEGEILGLYISANGRFIVFIWTDEPGAERVTYLLDIQSGIYETLDIGYFLGWRPHTTQLLFSDDEDTFALYDVITRRTQIYEVDPQYYPQYYAPIFPSWSRDGRFIAYGIYYPGGTKNESYSLYILDFDTGALMRVAHSVNTWAAQMQWASPSQVVYTYAYSEGVLEPPNLADLWLYDVTTRESAQLTDTPNQHEAFLCEWQ